MKNPPSIFSIIKSENEIITPPGVQCHEILVESLNDVDFHDENCTMRHVPEVLCKYANTLKNPDKLKKVSSILGFDPIIHKARPYKRLSLLII